MRNRPLNPDSSVGAIGHLQPFMRQNIHAGNGRSQGGAAIARGCRRGNGISIADGQGLATPASMKRPSNGRKLANRIVAIDPIVTPDLESRHSTRGSAAAQRGVGAARGTLCNRVAPFVGHLLDWEGRTPACRALTINCGLMLGVPRTSAPLCR